jgi:hypothetical protein
MHQQDMKDCVAVAWLHILVGECGACSPPLGQCSVCYGSLKTRGARLAVYVAV